MNRILLICIIISIKSMAIVPSFEEIDRTIYIPPSSWGTNQIGYYDIVVAGSQIYHFPLSLIGALLPFPPEHTTRTGWNFPSYFPIYTKKALYSEIDTTNNNYKLIGKQNVIEFGLKELSYSEIDGFNFMLALGYISKIKMNQIIWINYEIPINFELQNRFSICPDIELGLQVNHYISIAPFIGFSMNSDYNLKKLYYKTKKGIVLNSTINKYFSIYLTPQITYEYKTEYMYISLGYNLRVFW